MPGLNFSRSCWPCLQCWPCLPCLSCCPVSGWLDICVNQRLPPCKKLCFHFPGKHFWSKLECLRRLRCLWCKPDSEQVYFFNSSSSVRLSSAFLLPSDAAELMWNCAAAVGAVVMWLSVESSLAVWVHIKLSLAARVKRPTRNVVSAPTCRFRKRMVQFCVFYSYLVFIFTITVRY